MAAIDVPLVIDDAPSTRTPPINQAKSAVKPQPIPITPARVSHSGNLASSPGLLRSPSPRLHSPASSEIFERSVQEPVPISTLAGEPSAHLATHVIMEDQIPPALEASVQAITSQELNADEVEIVTSSAHQPAASQLEASTSQLDVSTLSSPSTTQRTDDQDSIAQSGLLPTINDDEVGSTYASIDPNDVRRLSFISFADIVQSEHQHPATLHELNANSPPLSSSLPKTHPLPLREASPRQSARSPASSISQPAGISTPPLIATRAILGAEASPVRGGLNVSHTGTHGELTVETLRQAVRKTASGDIGQSFRNPAFSPSLSQEETSLGRSRLNT